MDSRSLTKYTAQFLLEPVEKTRVKRTKIISTIGYLYKKHSPKCESVQDLGKLIDEGMNVARLNFSHGSHPEHLEKMNNIKQALKTRPQSHVSILLDTKGPEIRTGNNATVDPVSLKKGELLQITTDYNHLGTATRIACSYLDLPESTSVGKQILFADGSISSVVTKIEGNIVTVQILNDGKLGNKKNMCLPGTVISLPTITEKDECDIIEFGLKNKVEFIAVSFTRYKSDLDELRKLLVSKDQEHGSRIQLISKIENHEGVHNIDEIIEGSDGIMVARGDLGMEVPIEKVVILQKYIMEKTINKGKYVITATQLLESMESKPRPTRAQVSDVTNAVLDLSDAVMTSGETANGQFPRRTVEMMRKISQETERICDYKTIFERRKNLGIYQNYQPQISAVSTAFQTNADFIFITGEDLQCIRKLSVLRPKAFICVFTDSEYIPKATAFYFGVYCFPQKYNNPKVFLQECLQVFKLNKARIVEVSRNTQDGSFVTKMIQICV